MKDQSIGQVQKAGILTIGDVEIARKGVSIVMNGRKVTMLSLSQRMVAGSELTRRVRLFAQIATFSEVTIKLTPVSYPVSNFPGSESDKARATSLLPPIRAAKHTLLKETIRLRELE